MHLLDTNTLIYFFRRQGQVARYFSQTESRDVYIPSIALFELEHGILRSTKPALQRQGLDEVLQIFKVLDFDYHCAQSAALIKHTLELSGTPMGHYDLLIAGMALAHDQQVITRNTREFARVPRLRVANWYD